MAITRIRPGARLSGASVHHGLCWLAGQTADDLTQDVKGQTKQILDKIDAILAEAGTDKKKLLTVQIWLSDMRFFADMNSVYDVWLAKDSPPARATVEARLATPQHLVEIGGVAAI
ncbi:MAG: RidA family protein [Alphaproteobacteria bacterium]|nr:RidA family protein [Alphaproteobacteria bacterium]